MHLQKQKLMSKVKAMVAFDKNKEKEKSRKKSDLTKDQEAQIQQKELNSMSNNELYQNAIGVIETNVTDLKKKQIRDMLIFKA